MMFLVYSSVILALIFNNVRPNVATVKRVDNKLFISVITFPPVAARDVSIYYIEERVRKYDKDGHLTFARNVYVPMSFGPCHSSKKRYRWTRKVYIENDNEYTNPFLIEINNNKIPLLDLRSTVHREQ